jgi:hypothetical protein
VTLALDVETASPFRTPGYDDFDDTDCFELVAVALGHRPAPDADPETTVLFRRGGWDDRHTAALIERTRAWVDARRADGEPLLTYNGAGFDAVHLRGWADRLAADHPGLPDAVAGLFADHRDVAPVAGRRFADRSFPGRFPRFEDACGWAGVAAPPTRYADYDLDPTLVARVDGDAVTGRAVGETLGEAYVDRVAAGESPGALERLLADYAAGDVAPLFALADAVGVTR